MDLKSQFSRKQNLEKILFHIFDLYLHEELPQFRLDYDLRYILYIETLN